MMTNFTKFLILFFVIINNLEIFVLSNNLETESATGNDLRISAKKCVEYTSAIYEYVYSLSLALDTERKKIKVDRCAINSIPFIVGGDLAKSREFPHMALIGYGGPNHTVFWGCGGTLISDEFILTAGHCITNIIHGDAKYVRLGELDILSSTDDASPEDFEISTLIGHPDYKRSSKYNDIGLIKLIRKVEFDSYKRPACLPTFNEIISNKKVIATGWGDTEWSGSASSQLQKVALDLFDNDMCVSFFMNETKGGGSGIQSSSQICAGSKNDSKDTCQGDSGGPLQIYHPTEYCMYSIVGVTSLGFECGRIGIPGIYTRVFHYLDWIEEIVWTE